MSNQVVEEYYRKEYNNLIKRIRNRAGSIENAEDVVQEAFARALQYFDTWGNRADFGGWFRTILDNSLRDFQREERAGGATVHIEEVEDDFTDEIVDHYLPEVNNLKPHHKKVVKQYFHLGYTLKEISNVSGMPYETVNNIIRRFKDKIRAGND